MPRHSWLHLSVSANITMEHCTTYSRRWLTRLLVHCPKQFLSPPLLIKLEWDLKVLAAQVENAEVKNDCWGAFDSNIIVSLVSTINHTVNVFFQTIVQILILVIQAKWDDLNFFLFFLLNSLWLLKPVKTCLYLVFVKRLFAAISTV